MKPGYSGLPRGVGGEGGLSCQLNHVVVKLSPKLKMYFMLEKPGHSVVAVQVVACVEGVREEDEGVEGWLAKREHHASAAEASRGWTSFMVCFVKDDDESSAVSDVEYVWLTGTMGI